MLVLSALHSLLSQVLHVPDLHTVILFTPAGHLVSVATEQFRAKDDIHVVVGLSGEVWQETRDQGYGMVDSEVNPHQNLSCSNRQSAWTDSCVACR